LIINKTLNQAILFGILMLSPFFVRSEVLSATFNKAYASYYMGSPEKKLNYYYAITRQDNSQPTLTRPREALIAIHGYPHDALNTLNAVYNAALLANKSNILLVAPIFQVTAGSARSCAKTLQKPSRDDIQWTCGSWISGGIANNTDISSFHALDKLVEGVSQQWPTITKITIVGFSAGAQMAQHYIAFSAINDKSKLAINYVVAAPGIWLYFDNFVDRYPYIKPYLKDSVEYITQNCLTVNSWEYGLENIPLHLVNSVPQAKAQYQRAKISYLEGALDNGDLPGAYYGILDKSCAANAQGGNSRRQRGEAYMAYLRGVLKLNPTFSLVPNCAHDVNCVLTSKLGVNILFNIESSY